MKTGLRYPFVFLDADDTLFDYAAAESFALEQTCTSMGIRFTDELLTAYKEINGKLWRMKELGEILTEELRVLRFESLFAWLGLDRRAECETAADRYIGFLAQAGFLIEGAAELCRELKLRGAGLAIVTNGIKDVQLGRLSKSGLGEYIDHIVISDEAGVAKPAPELFDYAFRVCGLDNKKSVLMAGDSLTADIAGGNAYGLDTCWYNPRRLSPPADIAPDYIISDLKELREIVYV